jgi:hypothetical protein
MPTTRPRYQVTETEALARALELAEQEWPGEPRSRLIERLAAAGAEQLAVRHSARHRERVAAMDALADMFTGTFPPAYLEELRKDWPA